MKKCEGANVFVGGNIEEEPLGVRSDVEFDHAQTISPQRGLEGEEWERPAEFDAIALFRDGNEGKLVAAGDKVQFLAVTTPARPVPAIGGNLPHAAAARERNDEDLRAVRSGHCKGDKLAIRGKLPTGLQSGKGRGSEKGATGLTRSERVQPKRAATIHEALGENIAAVGCENWCPGIAAAARGRRLSRVAHRHRLERRGGNASDNPHHRQANEDRLPCK